MIYTFDLPSTDPKVNERLGYALPTAILLTPYLAANPYFVEYTQAIDEVFDLLVYSKMRAFSNIRNMWVGNSQVEELVGNEELIPFSAWSKPERELLIKQVNLLGMKIGNSGVIGDEAYLAISRFLGQYWLEKGRDTCVDFLNFCLGTDLGVTKLWTKDYQYFYPEGDPAIGTPIWESGGEWYPTTHVALTVKGGLTIDPQLLSTFFYDISNYNLVLAAIDQNYSYDIVAREEEDHAKIVAMALLANNAIAISSETVLGADPPDTEDFDWLSTQFYSNVGVEVPYFVGQPSGWMTYDQDKKLPVFGKDYQQVNYAHSLPTKCYGDGKILLGTRIMWVKIPGSPNSKARLPAYVPEMYLASVASYVPEFVAEYHDHINVVNAGRTVTVDNPYPQLDVVEFVDGTHPRGYVGVAPIPLSSPVGFVEVYPHCMVPYW